MLVSGATLIKRNSCSHKYTHTQFLHDIIYSLRFIAAFQFNDVVAGATFFFCLIHSLSFSLPFHSLEIKLIVFPSTKYQLYLHDLVEFIVKLGK